jgi:hypothetical protein
MRFDECRSGVCYATFLQCAACNAGNLDGDAIFAQDGEKQTGDRSELLSAPEPVVVPALK